VALRWWLTGQVCGEETKAKALNMNRSNEIAYEGVVTKHYGYLTSGPNVHSRTEDRGPLRAAVNRSSTYADQSDIPATPASKIGNMIKVVSISSRSDNNINVVALAFVQLPRWCWFQQFPFFHHILIPCHHLYSHLPLALIPTPFPNP